MEEDTKQCPNCKREIPSINFTTHSVHCARNLRNCPVCKEPVPLAQLQEHHDALHKEVPCKKCGESVCGTDLEDHIRDSCAQTIKPCKYCELELPRHALPPHEAYCGARSEQCPDCREYVMIKYRQLHLDSNHGFLRLSDGTSVHCGLDRYCELELPRHALPPHEAYCGARSEQCPDCREYVMIKYRQLHLDSNHGFLRLSDGTSVHCGLDRYCELELPRHALPPHEAYCGARSEQCPDCREYVMIKYRQLHLDSNHGFLRLSDGTSVHCGLDRYCELELPRHALPPHEAYCGARSEQCPDCREYVMIKYRQLHLDSNHGFLRLSDGTSVHCGLDRYCELELPRHALPPHEAYCGARSEQCLDCREYVMIKYRQLHLDSNHGFLRLSDDPPPIVVKAKPKPSTNGFANPSTSLPQNGLRDLRPNRPQNGLSDLRPQTDIHSAGTSNQDRLAKIANNGAKNVDGRNRGLGSINDNRVSTNDNRVSTNDNRVPSESGVDNRVERNGKVTMKRTNDQPQINTSVEPKEKVHKELPSRGAVKKRQAPPPPDPQRDLPYWSAQRRAQEEERRRQEQTAYNLSVGLPPVLSPAAKLEKLRKMDALHNREVDDDCRRGRTQRAGRVDDLSHLRPMTTQQFMDRFQELQLSAGRPAGAAAAAGSSGADRFSEIKSSLRELRRGLNEVTAPYNSASNATNNINDNRLSPPSPAADPGAAGDLRLPCEFCGVPIPADDLVLHQTGCRPDLTQFRPKTRPRSPRPPPAHSHSETDDPVIPCEFCTESLPVYLISEHQERCRRDANTLYPD